MNVGLTMAGRALALAATTFKGASLSFYSGTQPATPETPLSGNTELVRWQLTGPNIGSVTGGDQIRGIILPNPVPILASGTVTFARVNAPAWQPSTAYIVGQCVLTADGYLAFCTQAGTSASSGTGPAGAFLAPNSNAPDGTVGWGGDGALGSGLCDMTVGTSATDIIVASTTITAGVGNTESLSLQLHFPFV